MTNLNPYTRPMIDEDLIKKNILELLGLQELPEARKAAILLRMAGLVQDRVFGRIAEKIPEDQTGEFERLAESGDMVALRSFVEEYVGEVDSLIKEEVLKLQEELQEVVEKVSS